MTIDSKSKEIKTEKQKKISQIKGRIISALERSTFHGIDIIMETPKGCKRIVIILFVAAMSVLAISAAVYSLIGYLNFPYKTLVNYEQKSFNFPEVTICPFSPFNEAIFKGSPKDAQTKFAKIMKFWGVGAVFEYANMKHVKRSFTPLYYQYNKHLKTDWNTLFLSCYYNGGNCLGNIVDIEHPMAYQCFQISLNLSESNGARSGYARGLQLILFRNYNSTPLVMLNEFYDQIYLAFINNVKVVYKFDGVLIILHNTDEIPSYQLTASPNNYPNLYGNRISITVKEKYYKQTNTIQRRCSKKPVYFKLLKLSSFFMSRSIENQKKMLSLNLGNCASKYRQRLISLRCNCFTENEMIPLDQVHEFKTKGFCHDILWFENKSKEKILERIECSQKISLIPDQEILRIFRKKKVVDKLYTAKILCVVPCDRTILRLKRVQTNKLVHPMNLSLFPDYFRTIQEQNLQSPFDLDLINKITLSPENLMVLDIHAEEERIPILDEDRDKNLLNFVAEIGGVFGLFLGFSGVTAFEVIECLILLSAILIIFCRRESDEVKPGKSKKNKR